MNRYKKIVKLSPYISSKNIGDQIIADYCNSQILQIFEEPFVVEIPTNDKLGSFARSHFVTSDYNLVCGTNLLSSNMKQYHQWNITKWDAFRLQITGAGKKIIFHPSELKHRLDQHKAILFGVGWWQYQDAPDSYTRSLLHKVLSESGIHSVRDHYTEIKLRELGFENVLNTACPTMWNLTPEHCRQIPTAKSRNVVTTLTNYNVNPEYDDYMLNMLLSKYEHVYIWLQAIEDLEEIRKSAYRDQVHLIGPSLAAYDSFLQEMDADYVGTRLHGGIRALNYKHRTIIIAVDNRAAEISKDTHLPVIRREEMKNRLSDIISSDFETNIFLPTENIEKWKEQFK